VSANTARVIKLRQRRRAERDRPHAPPVSIGESELRTLRLDVDYYSLQAICGDIGICDSALLRILAGYFHRCSPKVRHAVIDYFADKRTRSKGGKS
jgi:hypothetical protein